MARKEGKFDSIRKFTTTSGVVEVINVPKGRVSPTYAWITTANGVEISLKLTTELIAKLQPGHIVHMTTGKSSGKYHILSTEPNSSPAIHIAGTAKYLSRTRNGWAVAVTTRSQRLKRKPLLKARLLVKPDFSQGERVTFMATFCNSNFIKSKRSLFLSLCKFSRPSIGARNRSDFGPKALCINVKSENLPPGY